MCVIGFSTLKAVVSYVCMHIVFLFYTLKMVFCRKSLKSHCRDSPSEWCGAHSAAQLRDALVFVLTDRKLRLKAALDVTPVLFWLKKHTTILCIARTIRHHASLTCMSTRTTLTVGIRLNVWMAFICLWASLNFSKTPSW